MTIEYNLEELSSTALRVINHANTKILLFYAEMGVGKTTLIKEICIQLGVVDQISSPTFSLVNEYDCNDGLIYHFDFYRIMDEEEVYSIGFEEYLDSDAWIFIEWPEKIPNMLPENSTVIKIKHSSNGSRMLSISS